jgi:hypothetical protein
MSTFRATLTLGARNNGVSFVLVSIVPVFVVSSSLLPCALGEPLWMATSFVSDDDEALDGNLQDDCNIDDVVVSVTSTSGARERGVASAVTTSL